MKTFDLCDDDELKFIRLNIVIDGATYDEIRLVALAIGKGRMAADWHDLF